MNILELIKKEIDSRSYKELEVVSAESGVPYGTLVKIKVGETENPRINTIQPLLNYFGKSKKSP